MQTTKSTYDHREAEARWMKAWKRVQMYTYDLSGASKPFYNLMMFPYPSAEGLHVGNMYAFTGSDIFGRFRHMQGYTVFEPIGLDGFGIHSENYALKIGRHPLDHAAITQKNFYNQLHKIGSMYDWSRTLATYDLSYYKWTQWLFVQMFKHGLAYRGKATVNWCPGCKTVLADEQVVKKTDIGSTHLDVENAEAIPEAVYVCERCGNIVENKLMEQWFFRITAYAENLLNNLRTLNWSEKVKKAQDRWIGKKVGIEIRYKVLSGDKKVIGYISCYTTRPDTNYGATFIAISPEHEFITQILRVTNRKQAVKIRQYLKQVKSHVGVQEGSAARKKTGVFTGLYCSNELNGYEMPIFISDFVLEKVGTGAIVGVPGHDKRDYEFAVAFNVPVKRVVVASDGKKGPIENILQVQEDEGTMINSGFLDGMEITKAKEAMMDFLVNKKWGTRVTTYHLRDWLISRQRYWGPPIPMIYCKTCAGERKSWFTTEEASQYRKDKGKSSDFNVQNQGTNLGSWNASGWYPVPENDLPVVLPRIEDYKPGSDGIAPLAKHKEFYETHCPGCGSKAVRETDVSDTFLDSSWYFLRYPSINDVFDMNKDYDPLTHQSAQNFSGTGQHLPMISQSRGVPGSNDTVSKGKKNMLHREGKLNTTDADDSGNLLPWDPAITKKWLPVDMYTGGAEHSVLHLMYSRFVTMALHDWGYLDFEEPFTRFYAHGLVIKDGAKMSKSKGNVVNPDEYIDRYGADALRMYLMFMGPFSQGGDFRDSAMEGMSRWVGRIWRLSLASMEKTSEHREKDIVASLGKLINKVSDDIEKRRYNTAIASMMEFTNFVGDRGNRLDTESFRTFILLLAPFAPHLAEELWQRLNRRSENEFTSELSVHAQLWPEATGAGDEKEPVDMVVQVNGKLRDVLTLAYDVSADQKEVERQAMKLPKVKDYLKGTPKKIIFVSRKVINFVI